MRPEAATAARVPPLLLPGLALATAALHLLFAHRYGYFRDELYFIACGQRLDWGYVDQPPLIAVATRLATTLFGHSLTGFRLLPALAAAGLVALTGYLVRRLGGGGFAVGLAALPTALAPLFLFEGHTLTMNSFEPLLWTGCAALLVLLIQTERHRLWLVLGALVGVGLLNKYSMGFFAACLGLGVLLTPTRRLLASRWLVLGVLLACALVLPNLLWQHHHGWPMLELLRNGQLYKNMPFQLGAFVRGQLFMLHPLSMPLSLTGLGFFLWAPAGRPYRALGLTYVFLFGLLVYLRAKDYYLAPAYPMLFAAGAVVAERLISRPVWRVLVLVPGVAGFAALAPLTLPVLPVDTFLAYQRALGLEAPRHEQHAYGALPQHYADQHGWEELVSAVAGVYQRLPPETRARTALFAQNYGEAGALDWLGRTQGLPPVRSGHNHYFLWGPGEEPEHLLVVGGDFEDLQPLCQHAELAGRVASNPYVMPYENNLPLYLCSGLKVPLATLWPSLKHYE
ncbi:MAG TPA: glycosyltransferase family 39 protein [Archangium sp.]|uniref:ArnT family glycosyltransferase n=1 Tax=Archangium sp. TaxID=1872627 RepID=UPI002ED940B1